MEKLRLKGVSTNQIEYLHSIRINDFTLAVGHAGSGKTYCAIGMALKHLFMPESGIEKIVIIRMALPALGDDIGSLPGDAYAKMYPYFGSILDNIEQFIDRPMLKRLVESQKIEIMPLAFLRGRTFKNCFIVVEEAQNVTKEAMKMILTRVGENSKMVITGDINQRDSPQNDCGLLDATERFKDFPGFGIVKLYDKSDIVRNDKTSRIIERYDSDCFKRDEKIGDIGGSDKPVIGTDNL